MMAAAKHGDTQMGVDTHLCVIPGVIAPVPLPTIHISTVFDPFDYIPGMGTTVTVGGMKSATAGTAGMVVHIPPGFPFAPPLPSPIDLLFKGSSTVVVDGHPMAHISHEVLGCQVAGMPSPIRRKKGGASVANASATTVNLATPMPVYIGGPASIFA